MTVELKDGPDRGRILFQSDPSGRHEFALAVDPTRFFSAYFGVFGPDVV